MNKYLLEIGVEEYPSRYIASTKEQLVNNISRGLKDAGLHIGTLRIESTPRRFAVWLQDIEETEGKREEIVRGPSKKAAYDESGQPTKALLGFLRGKGVRLEDTFIENNGKDDYVFVRMQREAISIDSVLAKVIPDSIRHISAPRAMRWGGKSIQFLRPIRWIVSLWNDQVLPFDFEGIPVSNRTQGHRFLGKKDLEIVTIDGYEQALKENYVIVDEKERRSIIVRGLNRLAREHGGSPLMDEELLDEVVHIVEYPTVFLGSIPADYLQLPKEILITPMKDHQRYFPVVNDNGNLLPYFLSVRNGDDYGIENVARGNEKVLVPRLEDAKFFYQQDLSIPFAEYVSQLDQLIFHEKLGNMREKSERLEKLTASIGKRIQCGSETIENAARAAELSKADLVTHMVVEFTELQGVMGRIYAEKSGENPIVAQAIEEQYMPRVSGGELPKATSGLILSLADKIDTIAGLYAIGIEVTGSQDPFGLRRAAIGMIDMIFSAKFHMDLKAAFRDALLFYVEQQGLVFDYDEVIGDINEFMCGRLKNKFRENGYRYDLIDAVMDSESTDLLVYRQKLNALSELAETDPEDTLITGFIRVDSMAKNADSMEVNPSVLQEEDQVMLNSLEREEAVKAAIRSDHFSDALELLGHWMIVINSYMDQTMILVEDEALRRSRLAMLARVSHLIRQILTPQLVVRENRA